MKRITALILTLLMLLGVSACGAEDTVSSVPAESAAASEDTEQVQEADIPDAENEKNSEIADSSEAVSASEPPEAPLEEPEYVPTEEELAERASIEQALDLRNMDQEWTYSQSYDAWTLSVVVDVVNPELPDQQGVSVAVPGAYVTGIDTDGDGTADVTAGDGEASVSGGLVIDHDASIVSANGQTYTADTCPVILTTGAAGYGSQWNSSASASYCGDGYVSVGCGNRGKQDYVSDDAGNVLYYTGDAPCCLVDQKAATRFVKYNMLLGNLPGCADYFVSTGGSGGAAHAAMFAATSNHPDFYDYQIEAGAVGVYQNSDGSYSTCVTIDGEQVEISDGAWGAVPYSAITSLYEADMAQAFEYYLDPTFSFSTEFQAKLAEYLSKAYMDEINTRGYAVDESGVGFDINKDGDMDDHVDLTIEYDAAKYPDTNGYGGTYLDLYLCEFTENLQWYLNNLPYASDWTWFDGDGNALSDEEVAAMTGEDLATAFLEGRYAKAGGGFGGPGGPPPGGMMGPPPDLMAMFGDDAADLFGGDIRDGGPAAGSSNASGSGLNSNNYATFDDMVSAYEADIAAIQAGDRFGKNIVDLYNPLNYIGAEGTDNPVWTRVVMGAVEGDMPMMASLNMQISWLNAGTDAVIEWQWDGGHVPNEVLGESLALYVDQMYGKYVSGVETVKPDPDPITTNGDSDAPSGKDLTGWVSCEDLSHVTFSLADALAYRNSGAMKAVPGFDVIDYGQEDYVFGSTEQDARHWNPALLEIFKNPEYAKTLSELFGE